MQRQRGFTLLEIMVVIVILGILASLVVPNLMGNKEKADRQKVVSDSGGARGERWTCINSTTAATPTPNRDCRRW
ncbi:pullulanase G protein [Klebsiella pneumoniae]|nr:pullulanase G protein [Klebsiella pneumoniae]